jgi:acyl-CoA synthetase (AMP-forming)/AMP-acid ligase II
MTLLAYSARWFPKKTAICIENEIFTYQELLFNSQKTAHILYKTYHIRKKDKVGLLLYNSIEQIESIFALSYLGADIYLLNADMTTEQLQHLQEKHKLKAILCENKYVDALSLELSITVISSEQLKTLEKTDTVHIPKSYGGKIIVLTGGTTGGFKTAKHKASATAFIHPTYALIKQLQIAKYESVYIAVPIFHSYGFATLLMSVFLGKNIYVAKKFETQKSITIIEKYAIEVVVFVPTMLRRVLLSGNIEALKSVKCIVCGAAPLPLETAKQTFEKLGHILYNLYGSSEAGFCIMASPQDLEKNIATIGKPIEGVNIRINHPDKEGIGELCIKSAWTINPKEWICTGDLARLDKNGLVFLYGRMDDMIISGGENIYPIHTEEVILKHPAVAEAVVIGVPDEDFGEVLKAFVVTKPNQEITEQALKIWLSDKLTRFQIPKKIELVSQIPYTSVGKVQRKFFKT